MNVMIVSGQNEQPYWPVQFFNVHQTSGISNPSVMGNQRGTATFYHQSFLGALSNINASYAEGFYKINDETNHYAGMSVFHEQEGDFFNRTAVYARYAIAIPLSRKISMKGGGRFGVFNYLIAPGPSSGGVSFWLPDGNVGFALDSDQWSAGAAVSQLFNTSERFAAREIQLNRYWSVHGNRTFQLTHDWEILTAAKIHWLSSDNVLADLSALVGYKGLYAGAGFRWQHGWIAQAGIQDLSFGSISGSLDMLFFQHAGEYAIPGAQQLEVALGLCWE